MKWRQFFRQFRGGPRAVLALVAFFVISLAFLTRLTDYSRATHAISYSTFLSDVDNGQVKAVHSEGQELRGLYKDGRRFETIIPENVQIWETLKDKGVEFSIGVTTASFTFWHFIFLIAVLGSLGLLYIFIRQAKGNGGGGIFTMGKSRAKMVLPSQVKVNFSSVAGAREAKEELKDIVDFLKNPEKYKKIGAKLPRGILLVGEPGNGKTLLAKAVAGEANCPFFSISGSDFVEVFVGVGAARIRDLFSQARRHAPSIVFIDEIDAIGRQRGSGVGGGHDEREQTLNQLLTEMDGFDSATTPVIVIAATNIADVLDKALLRPGRFDRRIEVPFPDTEARVQILEIAAKNVRRASDVDFAALAEKTAGFSGSDLANLVNQAAVGASKRGQELVAMEDFLEAYERLSRSQRESHSQASASPQTGSKARMYTPSQIKVNFESVAGAREAKEELYDVVDFLKNPEKYRRLGAELTRGVLLVGEPGNGKTLLAKAVAGESNRPFFTASGSEFVEVYVGVGAARIRDLFAQARRHAPSIVFIDEIDAIGRQRSSSQLGGNDEREQTLNQLLIEMDGFESDKASVVVLAATNRVDILDKALLRPGRFDRRVEVPYPDLVSREEILRVHARGKKIDESVDLSRVARGTPGFSGADLAHIVNEAVIHAAKHNRDAATIEDFEEARDKIILGKERKTVVMSPEELKMTAYHEAGHALVRLMMPEVTDPLYKVTIVPRGGALGVTHSLPERDKYSQSKDELIALIKTALGGRIAEEITFGALTTGAGSDFQKATQIAHNMVCSYGMSDELGTIIYEKESQFEYSPETARKIDDAIRAIIDRCYREARELLVAHEDKLKVLAERLLERETLYAQEIYELLGITPRIDHSLSSGNLV